MRNDPPKPARYWAFVSYSSDDRKWGAWLHRQLENFPIPREFRGNEVFDGGVLGKYLRPIFLDRYELSGSSDLGLAIQRALERSHFLVVLCSKHSAQSRWVNQEIETFRKLKGDSNILALILDGIPNASSTAGIDDSEECFPPALRYPNEPLAGDMRKSGDGRERGFLKVVAGIAQLDFDRLYRRHERDQQRRRFWIGAGIIALFCIMTGLSIVAMHQAKVAQANEFKARKALSNASLELGQQMRWRGDYASAIQYLTDSLRNDPTSQSASNIAWALLTSEGLRFTGKISELPEDRIIGAFTEDQREFVWIDSSGQLMSLVCGRQLDDAELHCEIPGWERREHNIPVKVLYLPSLNQFSVRYACEDAGGNLNEHEVRVSLQTLGVVSDEIVGSYSGEGPGKARTEAASVVDAAILGDIDARLARLEQSRAEMPYNYHLGRGVIMQHGAISQVAGVFSTATAYEDLIWRNHGGISRYEAVTLACANGALLYLSGAPIVEALFFPEIRRLLVTRHTYWGAPVLEWVDLSGQEVGPGINPSHTEYEGAVGDEAYWLVAPNQTCGLIVVNGRHRLVSFASAGRGPLIGDEVVGIDGCSAISGGFGKGDEGFLAGNRGIYRIVRTIDNRVQLMDSPWDVFGDGPEQVQGPVPGRFIRASDDLEGAAAANRVQWTRILAGKNILESIFGPVFHPLKGDANSPICLMIDSQWSARQPSSHACLLDPDGVHLLNRGYWGVFSRIDPQQFIVVSGGLKNPAMGNAAEHEACFFWVLKPEDEVPPLWLTDFLESVSLGKLSANTPHRERLLRNWRELAAAYGYEAH